MIFFGKIYVLDILTNTQNILFIKELLKISVIIALDGSISSCLMFIEFINRSI